MSASDNGVLNFSPSLSANPTSSEQIIFSNHIAQHHLPESSGTLNQSINEVNPEKSITIPSSDALRFAPPQPWSPHSHPVRQSPIEQSNQPQISFQDFQLFAAPVHPVDHNPTPLTIPNLPPSASPNGVGSLIQSLGYTTSSSQFTHRPLAQSQYPQRAISQSLYRQRQQSRLVGTPTHPSRHSFSPGRPALSRAIPYQIITSLTHTADMKEEDFADFAGSEFSSPAFGTIHDPSIPLSATVSPRDIFAYQPTMTPLNPALASPYFDVQDSSYDASPVFKGEDFVGELWPPLFDDADDFNKVAVQEAESVTDAPVIADEDIEAILRDVEGDAQRCRSSVSMSPQANRSSIGRSKSGIRKRTHPLPPIVVEDKSDLIAVKRARNTLAARKSRQKKVERMEEMEVTIEQLKEEVEKQKREAERWKAIAMQTTKVSQPNR